MPSAHYQSRSGSFSRDADVISVSKNAVAASCVISLLCRTLVRRVAGHNMTPNSWVLDGELHVQEFRDAVPRVAELVCTIEARLSSLLQWRPTGRATCDKRLKVDSAAVSADDTQLTCPPRTDRIWDLSELL